ncbi:hypothetical protein [Okeania sp. SIO2C9]|uniref:hypothetical protein n=1 Tax=Okeania sp. SIO2C9 TaxID=2607791 RepID=UPI0025F946AE|nr:hypothetical protein [Okeania sp. SIO2C9]
MSYQLPCIIAILWQDFSCQLISASKITFLLISANLMLIILMFASSPLPHSPAKQNLEKPRNRCFTQEFVYEKEEVVKPQLNQGNVLGIDHGVNNWLTCVSNVGTSTGSRW